MENSLKESFNPLDANLQEFESKYISEMHRGEVRSIVGSYHHTFDHCYEGLQNAVDICEKAFWKFNKEESDTGYDPEIAITINLKDNSITIIDNALGMSNDIVTKYFFTPHATTKREVDGKIRQRGEKGVGATFLSYGTDYIHLTTLSYDTKDMTSAQLEKGLSWCISEAIPDFTPKVVPAEPHKEFTEKYSYGTAITIKFSDKTNINILSEYGLQWEQWEAIFRLYTALGYVSFDENDEFFDKLKVTLTLINEDRVVSKTLNLGYLYPHELTDSNIRLSKLVRTKGILHKSQQDKNILWETFSFTQVADFIKKRMDNQKYMRMGKKTEISTILNTYQPEAYVCFTSGADFWQLNNFKIWGEEFEGQLRSGVLFTTRSQKIGEQKRIEFIYRTGDFSRFFIILNMKKLKGDIGRKSLGEKIDSFANFFANAIHDIFTDNDDCLAPWTRVDEEDEAELEDLKDSVTDKEDNILDYLHFKKEPKEEQDVIAMFFDLLGMEKIKGYQFYSTHISKKYDGIGMFQLSKSEDVIYNKENLLGVSEDKFKSGEIKSPKKCFFEFKMNSDQLVSDVRNGYKRLQDIKWLICWEIGKKHKDEGISVINITQPEHINYRNYYATTHLMSEGENSVFVIELKKVLEILKGRK